MLKNTKYESGLFNFFGNNNISDNAYSQELENILDTIRLSCMINSIDQTTQITDMFAKPAGMGIRIFNRFDINENAFV